MTSKQEKSNRAVEKKSETFMIKHNEALKNLSFLRNYPALQDRYITFGASNKAAAFAVMMVDIYFINLIAMRSGIKFAEFNNKAGALAVHGTLILCGLSGSAKSNLLMNYFKPRLTELSHHILAYCKHHKLDDISVNEAAKKKLDVKSMEKMRHIDLGFKPIHFKEVLGNSEINRDKLFELEGDRIRSIVTDIFRHGGQGVYICEEMKSKIQELTAGGDKSGGQFLIKLSDNNLSALLYSGDGKSTPSIANKRTGLIGASTPACTSNIMNDVGLDGVLRRCTVVPCAIARSDPDEQIAKYYEAEQKEQAEYKAAKKKAMLLNDKLTLTRDLSFWVFLHTTVNSEGKRVWRTKIPEMELSWRSTLLKEEFRLKKEQKCDSADVVWPEEYLDTNGNIKSEYLSANDVYYRISKEEYKQSLKPQTNIIKSCLKFSKLGRWSAKAFGLSMRLYMDQMTDTSWIKANNTYDYTTLPTYMDDISEFKLNTEAAIAANRIEDLTMEYAETLTDLFDDIGEDGGKTDKFDQSFLQQYDEQENSTLDENAPTDMQKEMHAIYYFAFLSRCSIEHNTDIRIRSKGIVRHFKKNWAKQVNHVLNTLQADGLLTLKNIGRAKIHFTLKKFEDLTDIAKTKMLDLLTSLLANKPYLQSAPFTNVDNGAFNIALYLFKSDSDTKKFYEEFRKFGTNNKLVGPELTEAWMKSAKALTDRREARINSTALEVSQTELNTSESPISERSNKRSFEESDENSQESDSFNAPAIKKQRM